METILLVIHLILALALVGAVLLQRSEGGGLGIGGGSGGLMSVRGTANLLTRVTAVLAACFMATSLTLAIMAGARSDRGSILDQPSATSAPPASAPSAPAAPAEAPKTPEQPSVPLSK